MIRNLLFSLLLVTTLAEAIPSESSSTKSFMSDKTEVAVNLEVSGAEAICQTADGYVWIAQYSGLTRYDSTEYVTYKSFTENNTKYDIINVRALAADGNTLYVATNKNLFVYKDYEFSYINVEAGLIRDIALDKENELLYISSVDQGATLYNIKTGLANKLPGLESGSVNDIALDTVRNSYYFQTDSGVFNSFGSEIYLYPRVLDIYSYGEILYIGNDDGLIKRYDMSSKVFLEDLSVHDQINKMLYSEDDNTLFVACENNGLYCVNFSYDEPYIASAGELENKNQLIDLMIDYQGNLWFASHFAGSSGVSLITKNALLDLLYDDVIWQEVAEIDRGVLAIERYQDIQYIVSSKSIYLYDLKAGKIVNDNVIMTAINNYAIEKGISYSPKDIEIFKEKIYFAITGIGLVEYNPSNDNLVIYDAEYIADHISKVVEVPDISIVAAMRCLRSFDNYLAIGYTRGVAKFDGTNFSAMGTGPTSVLYLSKSNEGKLLFNRSAGIFEIDDDFTTYTQIPTIEGVEGNVLKFLVDNNKIYYNLNSRLFKAELVNGEYIQSEIIVPHVQGSIVELSKIAYHSMNGELKYKYVIASQTQIYIVDNLDTETLNDYEFYDSTNGLKTIAANTSGYYDVADQKYYFQSTNGIFVYDFNEERSLSVPVKIDVHSIVLDGVEHYGNNINISKDTYRITINLSIFGFKPHKGYSVYYKLEGIDKDYHLMGGDDYSINFTNLAGGKYKFRAYVLDEYGQKSNEITITLVKEKKIIEYAWFWIIIALLALSIVVGIAFFIIQLRTRSALRKQLEYKHITLESIQAIARTIDAKDEYTNGHSTRVGYYSRIIAENLGMSKDELDNMYYIALLHDIGKIAIPDKILNKPGKLTDEEFVIMKSHTLRGAKILKGISTIPHIIEGAKSHHERWDGRGYPEGLKGEEIPYVARIICCADCIDAMATRRVYKEPIPIEEIAKEFERCSGTNFDPDIAKVVINMIHTGKLKPYAAENDYYLADDGKTYRVNRAKEEK